MKKQQCALLLAIPLLLSAVSCSRAPYEESPASLPDTGPAPFSAVSRESRFATPEPQIEEPESTPPVPELARMMETMDRLCGGPRPIGSEAERLSAQFLQERLHEYGYESGLEPFAYRISHNTLSERYRQARDLSGEAFFAVVLPGEHPDGYSQNVVARQPGEGQRSSVLVLSAHYDSTPDSLGVVDNAAGVSVVVEAARILAEEDLPFYVRIVLFGGEEEILIGSRLYLAGMEQRERERIVGNITVDTLAYSQQEDFVALTTLDHTSGDRAALMEASPIAAALLANPRVSPAFASQLVGDHMAFAEAGIDSVNFGQSMDEVMGIINSPADTYDILTPELLPTAVDLLVESVRTLAESLTEAPASPPPAE